MTRILHAFIIVLILGGPVWPRSLELDNRISDSLTTLKSVMMAPDGGIPKDLLKRSRGIVVFPAVLKAGFGVGGHYGKGVALRRDPRTRRWGPPAFMSFWGGSVGWQIGLQSTDLVLLFMSDVSLKSLFRDKFTIGADASIAAGPVGRDAGASTDFDMSASILSYSKAKGLFAGVALKGSVIEPDWVANQTYYGSDNSLIDLFFSGKGTVSPAAYELIRFLNRY